MSASKILVDAFGHQRNVFDASLQTLTAIPGIVAKTAANVKGFNGWHKIEEELYLLEKYDARLITYRDSLYPRSLLNIYDFSPFLYMKELLKDNDVNIAVAGSRMASTYGKFSTERLCRELAINGIAVVSRPARGIDPAAHKGAVITEYRFGTGPSVSNSLTRNRIISGVSLGVVVVEANEKSGSLITAKLSLEQGREVFTIPGSIDSAGSIGTHKLIKRGAKLI
ncbi:MAG: DNA-processing protein DprA [Syntrophales bacterium]